MPEQRRTTYADLAFGPRVRARLREVGADNRIDPPGDAPFLLDGRDRRLIREADFFLLSTVTEAGWPYTQHKGGPRGFVQVTDGRTLVFPDFPGNRQFVTLGNLDAGSRVCLFFVDFPTRRRLKVFGRARTVEAADDPQLIARLGEVPGMPRRIDRAVIVQVTDVDANCSRNITPRWDGAAVDERIDLYRRDIAELKAEVARLRSQLG